MDRRKLAIAVTLVVAFMFLAARPTSAHYGEFVSQYALAGSAFEGTNFAQWHQSAEEAQVAWLIASEGTILRVGYIFQTPDNARMDPKPVNDVRLVAIDGVIVCASENPFGCNGF